MHRAWAVLLLRLRVLRCELEGKCVGTAHAAVAVPQQPITEPSYTKLETRARLLALSLADNSSQLEGNQRHISIG